MGDFELDLVLDLGPPCSDAIHLHFTLPRRGDKDRQSLLARWGTLSTGRREAGKVSFLSLARA
jgi:hypothetical protein